MGAGARLRVGAVRHRRAARPGPAAAAAPPGPQQAELDFTESTDRLLFERRFGWVDIEADWLPAGSPPDLLHAELRREARDFLHDLLADLTDLHDDLAENPAIWPSRPASRACSTSAGSTASAGCAT